MYKYTASRIINYEKTAFSSNGQLLLDHSVIYDLTTLRPIKQLLLSGVHAVALSTNGRKVAYFNNDVPCVSVHKNSKNPLPLPEEPPVHSSTCMSTYRCALSWVSAIAYAPDNNVIAFALNNFIAIGKTFPSHTSQKLRWSEEKGTVISKEITIYSQKIIASL